MVLVSERVPYSLIGAVLVSRRLRLGFAVSAVSCSCMMCTVPFLLASVFAVLQLAVCAVCSSGFG